MIDAASYAFRLKKAQPVQQDGMFTIILVYTNHDIVLVCVVKLFPCLLQKLPRTQ